jgi:hypothetical protein
MRGQIYDHQQHGFFNREPHLTQTNAEMIIFSRHSATFNRSEKHPTGED